jgi:hypothetical protein
MRSGQELTPLIITDTLSVLKFIVKIDVHPTFYATNLSFEKHKILTLMFIFMHTNIYIYIHL